MSWKTKEQGKARPFQVVQDSLAKKNCRLASSSFLNHEAFSFCRCKMRDHHSIAHENLLFQTDWIDQQIYYKKLPLWKHRKSGESSDKYGIGQAYYSKCKVSMRREYSCFHKPMTNLMQCFIMIRKSRVRIIQLWNNKIPTKWNGLDNSFRH